MVKVVWMPRAIQDLNSIAAFIALDSPKFADITIDKIFKKTEILIQFPLIGNIFRELGDENIREIVEGNYRIIYQLKSNDLAEILTVHHSKKEISL